MQIVIRNFFKLLSAGAFRTNIVIEEMSEYKWNQLLHIAKINKVEDFIISGIMYTDVSSNIIIPEKIKEVVKTHTNNVSKDALNGDIYKHQKNSVKKFSNPYLNNKLNVIIYNEIHCIDTSIDSLTFLSKSIDNIKCLLTSTSYIRDLVEFGIYLREHGHKIDFIKFNNWLSILKMRKIMGLISQYLIHYLNFNEDEIPFCSNKNTNKLLKKKLLLNFEDCRVNTQKDIYGLIYYIPKPNTNMFRYFLYFPLETTSIFISNVFNSLSNIEE